MLVHCHLAGKCLLLHATKAYRQTELTGCAPFDFAAALKRLLEAKKAANRKPVYLTSLRGYLARFGKGRETKPLADFTTADVESWLLQFAKPYTRQTWLNRISTLFAFAVRRGMIARNPCAVIERVTVDKAAPLVLSPGQVDTLLKIAPTVCRPYLILGLFAGIRPDELLRLTWADVDLNTRCVAVNDAKTRRRRIVPLEARAVALLAAHPLQKGPVSPSNSTVRRFKRVARRALNLPSWPSDLLRHTAASYLLARDGDAGKVATRLGNSSAVMLSHYHRPVSQADSLKYWGEPAKRTLTNAPGRVLIAAPLS